MLENLKNYFIDYVKTEENGNTNKQIRTSKNDDTESIWNEVNNKLNDSKETLKYPSDDSGDVIQKNLEDLLEKLQNPDSNNKKTLAYPSDDGGDIGNLKPIDGEAITLAYPSDDGGDIGNLKPIDGEKPIGGVDITDAYPSDDASLNPNIKEPINIKIKKFLEE